MKNRLYDIAHKNNGQNIRTQGTYGETLRFLNAVQYPDRWTVNTFKSGEVVSTTRGDVWLEDAK